MTTESKYEKTLTCNTPHGTLLLCVEPGGDEDSPTVIDNYGHPYVKKGDKCDTCLGNVILGNCDDRGEGYTFVQSFYIYGEYKVVLEKIIKNSELYLPSPEITEPSTVIAYFKENKVE